MTAKTGKRYLIFDPTWETTPFGQLEYNLQGSYGVLMEGPDSQVIRLPVLDPGLNTWRRSATFALKPDGELTGNVTEKQFGDLSVRRRDVFARETAAEQQKYMDRSIDHDFSNVKLTDLKVENVAALNKDLTTTYAIDATNYATQTGPLLMVRPRVLGTLAMYVDRKERKVPIDLGSTRRESDEFDIELPPGYAVDELPDPVKLDVGFAVYESSTVVTGQKLHYTRSLTMREVTLSADKYPEMQHLAGVIDADEQSRAILKKTN